MNLFRISWAILLAGLLIVAAALGTYQISGNVWYALLAIAFVSAALMRYTEAVLGIGMFFGQRKAERERNPFGGLPHEALLKRILAGAKAHNHSDEEEEDEELGHRLEDAAESIKDADLREALMHFTHIAMNCPGSKGHAERFTEVMAHVQARLKASTVQPLTEGDRVTLH